VQYHTKGEFQPVVPIVSSSQSYQTEETESESEIFHPTAEEPLHETTEIPKELEEAYIPPVQPAPEPYVDKGKEPEIHYAPWDASRSVLKCLSMSKINHF